MMYLSAWLGITIFIGCVQLVLFIFTTFPIALAHHRAWKRVVQEDLRVTPMTAFQRYRFFMIRYFKWGSFAMMIPLILWIIYVFVTTTGGYSPSLNDFYFFSLMSLFWYGTLNLITTTFFLLFPDIKGNLVNSLILSFVFQIACVGGLTVILLQGFKGIEQMSVYDQYDISIILTSLLFLPTLFMFCIGVIRFDLALKSLDAELKHVG